ncbi:hypothetical protein PO909_031421, partial [Leuciscus waleckii]
CDITSISSPTASSLLVKWTNFPGATNYVLDVRAVNSSNTAPVSIPPLASSTLEKLVQGLRPGQIYQVTFKVFLLSYVTCISSQIGQTIPATSQISFSKAISSTSIRFEWSSAQGADKYILMVEGTFHNEIHNLTFTTLNGQVDNLRNNTAYNCYIYSSNAAGIGAKSLVKTIRTLVQPPDGVSVRELTPSMARVSWFSVPSVLLYQVSVKASNKPGLAPVLRNVTSTAVNISSLEPCLTYTIGVASVNMFLEPGEPTNINYTTPTPCLSSSVSAIVDCATDSALVSWSIMAGADNYTVTALGSGGQRFSCSSQQNNCNISSLQCGQLYNLTFTSTNQQCQITSATNATFRSMPCEPTNVTANIQCGNSSASLSWVGSTGAVAYVGIAQSENGTKVYCQNTETSCTLMGLVCGTVYNFTVQATDGTCNSTLSKPQIGGAGTTFICFL